MSWKRLQTFTCAISLIWAAEARALLVSTFCNLVLSPVTRPLGRAWRRHATPEQRARIETVASSTSGFGEDLRTALRYPSTVGALARKHRVARRARRSYTAALVGLVALGSVQPWILERTVAADVPRAELAEDEFELVSGGIHVWLHVGGHNYDYMGSVLRRDAGGLVGDLEVEGTTRIRFRVTPTAIRRLRADLEASLGKTGPLSIMPFVNNNCVSNALRRVSANTGVWAPPAINRSPSLTFGYFKLKRTFGDPRIVDVYFEDRRPGASLNRRFRVFAESMFSALTFSNSLLISLTDPPATTEDR